MTKVIILIIVIGAMITLWTILYVCACEHLWIFDPDFYKKRGYDKDIEELRKEIRELKDQMNDIGFFDRR